MLVKQAACVGGGVIGGGWIARLVLNGVNVAVFDPDPEAERKIAEVMANAERAFAKLTLAPRPPKGQWRLASSIDEAVDGAELVVESVPERLELKHQVYRDIEAAAAPEALIASSTSGYKPSDLQQGATHPGRILVAHPFNPVYLLPLVEIVGGPGADPAAINRALEIYPALGMKPLQVRQEIDAFIADRFLEAVWREALWLIKDGVATTEEIDDAIRYGFGLRWAQMGLFETYRVAGGEAGMRHFIAQFGPCLSFPWTKLTDVPDLTDDLIDAIADQSDAQSGRYSIRELERIRDDNLVAIIQALRGNDWGAGAALKAYEEQLYSRAHAAQTDAPKAPEDLTKPLLALETSVQPDWVDYNNHMTESRYLQVFGDCSDALFRRLGIDASYHARGLSYYTVETHIMHIDEVAGLEPIYATTQVLSADEKRIHVFHRIHHGGDHRLLASAEQMLLHVDTKAQKACPADPAILAALEPIKAAHAELPAPEAAGRRVGERK